MSLTKSIVENVFKAARSQLAGATVTVRHDDREYSGVRGTLETERENMDVGLLQSVDGMVRLLVSELGNAKISEGDSIYIKEQPDDQEWSRYYVKSVRYDQTRATGLVMYGGRYG